MGLDKGCEEQARGRRPSFISGPAPPKYWARASLPFGCSWRSTSRAKSEQLLPAVVVAPGGGTPPPRLKGSERALASPFVGEHWMMGWKGMGARWTA